MAFAEVLRTVFEFAAVVLLIVGFIYEKKVVAFEVKLARAIRIHLRNRRLRKQRENAARIQPRDAGALYVEEKPAFVVVQGTETTERLLILC